MKHPMNTTNHARSAHAPSPLPAGPTDAICVESLFAGAREVKLTYGEQEYRLRITRNSKLILTK